MKWLACILLTVAVAVGSPPPVLHNPFSTNDNVNPITGTVPITNNASITVNAGLGPYGEGFSTEGFYLTTNGLNGRILTTSYGVTDTTGTLDMYAFLTNAIAKVPDHGVLYLPRGTFSVSKTVVIDSKSITLMGDCSASEYTYRLYGPGPAWATNLTTTVIQPNAIKSNFDLFQVTDTLGVKPSVTFSGLTFNGLDGISNQGTGTNAPSSNGPNYDFTVTFTGTNANAINAESLTSLAVEATDCNFVGWSGAGIVTPQGARINRCFASLCGVAANILGSDTYIIEPWFHHCREGIDVGSSIADGDAADVVANWVQIIGGRIEWIQDYGVRFKTCQRPAITGTHIDRCGFACVASDGLYNYYGRYFLTATRGGIYWRGVLPVDVPLTNRNQAANIFLQHGNESSISGFNGVLNSMDDGSGKVCPPIGIVLDDSRATIYTASGAFDGVNNVQNYVTNSQNNVVFLTPNNISWFDDNGVRFLYDNGSNSLVVLHQFTAPYIASTGTNDPQLLVSDAVSTNGEALLRFTRFGTNNLWSFGLGGNNHLLLTDNSSAHVNLDLASDHLSLYGTGITLDTFGAADQNFLNFEHAGSSKFLFGLDTDNAFEAWDSVAGNALFKAYTGGNFNVYRTLVANFLQATNLAASSVVITDGSKNLVSVSNGTGVLANDGSGGLSWVPGTAITITNLVSGVITQRMMYSSSGTLTNVTAISY